MIEHVIIKHVMTQRDMIKRAMSTGSELSADCEGCGGGGGVAVSQHEARPHTVV